jgi:hypothetical protein
MFIPRKEADFMETPPTFPQWAPRVKQSLIWQIYESDARGMLDETLVDEAGWALWHRCNSFIAANEAVAGRAPCPRCGAVVQHHSGQAEILTCTCGWSLPWKEYFSTIQHRQLSGAEPILAVFRKYVETFPRVETAQEKMLQIDILIHEFHWQAQHTSSVLHTPGARACAVNLIEGSLHEVVQFLNRLSTSPSSTPGILEQREAWRKVINEGADWWKDPGLRV